VSIEQTGAVIACVDHDLFSAVKVCVDPILYRLHILDETIAENGVTFGYFC
jgi:hypothetical protein